MTKTIMILAIAAAFMVGTTMSFVVSDFEAEAKPKDPKPPFIDPIFKPINATLAEIQLQLAELKEDTDAIKSTGNDHGIILGDLKDDTDAIKSTGNDHGVILGGLETTADGIKLVVDTIDAKVP